MTRMLSLLLCIAPLPACASPALPLEIRLSQNKVSAELYSVSARPGEGGIAVSGRVRRPARAFRQLSYSIVASVRLVGSNQLREASVPLPRLPHRGPRTGVFRIFIPLTAGEQAEGVTVALQKAI